MNQSNHASQHLDKIQYSLDNQSQQKSVASVFYGMSSLMTWYKRHLWSKSTSHYYTAYSMSTYRSRDVRNGFRCQLM